MKNIIAILFVFTSLFASSQTQYIGAPNTTVVARGNMKIDSILYLPKREKTPTDTGALRYQISDSSLYVWTGNAWRKAKNDGTITSVSAGTGMSFTTITSTGSVSADTNVLSTKAWRQKGDDSLGAIIATKGTGTVTSVGSGYGINGGTITTTGTLTADTLNLATRLRLQKVGDSLGLLISNAGGGTVTGVSAGIGMSFATITSSGAVNADTAILSTKAWRQKGIDSVSQNLGLYLPLVGGTLTGGLTGTTGAFNSSGSGNTFSVNHSSGAGIAVNIEKGGNGEGLYVNKTSGTGNAATIIGTLNATTLVKSGGTSSQYLMADGSTSTLTNPVTGTGTTNYVSKWTGTSTQAISQIFDNGTSVGIGTASPAFRLEVNTNGFGNRVKFKNTDTSSASVTQFDVENSVGNALQIFTRSATASNPNEAVLQQNSSGAFLLSTLSSNPIKFNTSNTERMRIVGAGDVGIGNTSPAYKLDITGTLRNTTGAAFATSSGNVLVGTTTDAGYKFDVAGSLRNTTGANFATSSGRVGIGTTSPSGKLHVVGNFEPGQASIMSQTFASIAQGGTAGFGNFDSSGTRLSYWAHDSTGMVFFNAAATRPTIFYGGTSGLERMRIAPWGFLGVGITNPLGRIVAAGSESGILRGLILRNSNGTTNSSATIDFETSSGSHGDEGSMAGRISGIRTGAGTTGAIAFSTTNSGTLSEKVRIIGDGNVGIGNTSPSEKLHVTGRIRATTIDSTATGMNMLYADATGVIKKAAVPSGGSGTVTSITAGTGLTGGTITTSGTIAVDTASIATRARVQKGIDSVTTLANTKVSGTGISGYFPKWTGTSSQDTSQLFQLGRNIGIGTATPTYRIHLPDAGSTANQAMIAGMIFGSDGNGVTMSPNSSNITIKGGQGNGSIYSGTISSVARWGINTTSISDAVFSVDGDVKIVTIDSTATARNMLYQDANGIIKKSAVPSGVSGSGTTNYLPKWTSGTGLGNSVAYDNGGELLISTTEDAGDFKLQVAGAIYTTSTISTGGVNGETSKTWKLGSRRAAAVSLDTTQYLEVEVNGVLYYIAMITIN